MSTPRRSLPLWRQWTYPKHSKAFLYFFGISPFCFYPYFHLELFIFFCLKNFLYVSDYVWSIFSVNILKLLLWLFTCIVRWEIWCQSYTCSFVYKVSSSLPLIDFKMFSLLLFWVITFLFLVLDCHSNSWVFGVIILIKFGKNSALFLKYLCSFCHIY